MTSPASFVAEEPIRSNPTLLAVDEATGQFVLAEFPFERACRYSFCWRRGDTSFDSGCIELLNEFSRALGQPMQCVGAWNHDANGSLRSRHRIMISRLQRASWLWTAKEALGVAVLTSGNEVTAAVSFARELRIGWFVAFGAWASPEVLASSPFEATMKSLGSSARLAPSVPFLNGLADHGATLAYALRSDDRLPTVVLITPARVPGIQSLLRAD